MSYPELKLLPQQKVFVDPCWEIFDNWAANMTLTDFNFRHVFLLLSSEEVERELSQA